MIKIGIWPIDNSALKHLRHNLADLVASMPSPCLGHGMEQKVHPLPWCYSGSEDDPMQLAEMVENGVMSRKPVGLVTCPNCRVVMPHISLKSLEDEKDLNEAVYRCRQCETETRRWIKL